MFRGDGHGGLTSPVAYRGDLSRTLLVDDFDDDGHQDIAALSGSGDRIHVLYGAGDGTFEVGDDFVLLESAQENVAVDAVLADLDADGRSEIITVAHDSLQVLSIHGRNVALRRELLPWSGSTQIAAGDFNGDGAVDIACSLFSGGVHWLAGDGAGHLVAQMPSTKTPFFSLSLFSSDLDGDGRDDLVTLNLGSNYPDSVTAPTISVLMSDGLAQFQRVDYLAGLASTAATIFDANQDGLYDVVVGDQSTHGLLFRPGVGNGSFGDVVQSDAGLLPWSLGHADFDGDGIEDVVGLGVSGGTIALSLGTGQGMFQSQVPVQGGSTPWDLGVADFDGDGSLDLAVSDAGSANALP